MLLAVLPLGCATTESNDTSFDSRDDCFLIRQINNWDAIDRSHIYIEGVGDDKFLLTMFSSCPGIKYTQAIALQDSMGRVCPNDFGRIVYRDGRMRQQCNIDNVERVASKEAAIALVDARSEEE
jgi:hypothetical protein